MKEAEPADLDSTDTNQPCCSVPYRTKQKVDRYLAEQDLSDDKAQAVQILRDHFTAMHEGRSEADDYEAPYLMVCGGPGNGKSKLVETIDGELTKILKYVLWVSKDYENFFTTYTAPSQ